VSTPGNGFLADEFREGRTSNDENGRYYNHSGSKTQTLGFLLRKNLKKKKNSFLQGVALKIIFLYFFI
jgi:hypothetical protein